VWADTPGGIGKSFVYGFTFMFWEQYVYTYETLYLEIGLSCIAIVVCTAIFLRSVIGSLMMLVIILKIVVEVSGL
jgi:patched 1 protein/patched 2 protein